MKKKNIIQKSLVEGIFIGIMLCSSNVFSQGQGGNNGNQGQQPMWRTSGNSLSEGDFIGSTNQQDFLIKTNNQERIRVTTDNYTIFEDSVRIKGPLYVGDSSLVLGNNPPLTGTDNIQSTNGVINFGRHFTFPPIDYFSDIRLGVGTQNPSHMMQLHESRHSLRPVRLSFTNSAFTIPQQGTGGSATDGFVVGIASDGTAQINQQENHNMEFYTGDGTENHTRMLIRGEDAANQGFVGIGQNFNNPQSLLSVDGSDDNTGEVFRTNTKAFNSFWRMNVSDNEMGNIFSRVDAPEAIDNDNFGIQASENDITFHTIPLDNGIGEERMRIVGNEHDFNDGHVDAGNVGIGVQHPLSMLHIGEFSTGGWRDWMDIGTYYALLNDNMYVGILNQPAEDVIDAVINWGNNPTQTSGGDRLRFIFTAWEDSPGQPTATEYEGLEIARMISPDGNIGRMGIGDFNTLGTDPTHTLDVLGNARLRELPEPQWQDNSIDRFVVVDDDGVLHWSDDVGTGAALGNICDDDPATNPLDEDWEIALNNNNFVFKGQGDGTG